MNEMFLKWAFQKVFVHSQNLWWLCFFVPLVNAPMVAEKVFEKNCRGIFGMGLGHLEV